MIVRKILVPLSGRYDPDDPESLDVPALQAAFLIAAKHQAHVEVLSVIGDPARTDERLSAWIPSLGVREVIEWMEREGELRRRRTKNAFETAIANFDPRPPVRDVPGPGFSASYVEQIGEIEDIVGAHGRVSDLIVVANSTARWEMPFRPILEATLRRTSRPVFVSPPRPFPSFATRVAIAWNDTLESARAVAASLDLVRSAEHVLVISCGESKSVSPKPDRLIDYLGWHGVKAEAATLSSPPRSAAGAIVDRALSANCDLVILGAYIHSRAHSLLFGSLTEHVLSDPKVPALLVP